MPPAHSPYRQHAEMIIKRLQKLGTLPTDSEIENREGVVATICEAVGKAIMDSMAEGNLPF